MENTQPICEQNICEENNLTAESIVGSLASYFCHKSYICYVPKTDCEIAFGLEQPGADILLDICLSTFIYELN